MKKILSVLLSLLLLCSCIPLGAVTAATAATVYGTVDRSDVAPGDTFTMSVQMENNPGLVCWLIDVDFDSAALELVSQAKGDAFSGIGTFSFGPMKEGYTNALWYDFLSRDNYTNNGHLFSLTFRVKEDAPAGNYPITLYCSDWDNMCDITFSRVDFDFVSPTVTVVAAEEPECQHEYFYPCDQYCMYCGEKTNPDASHNVIAVEAKDATCVEMGNIAYWFCDICGAAWLNAECTLNTNLMAVKLPALDHVYDDAYDADCNTCGAVRDVPVASPYDPLDNLTIAVEAVGLERFGNHPEMGQSVVMRAPSTLASGESYLIYKNEGMGATAIEVGGIAMDGWGFDLAVFGRNEGGSWVALEYTYTDPVDIGCANAAFKQGIATVNVSEQYEEIKVAMTNIGAAWTFALNYVDITWGAIAEPDQPDVPVVGFEATIDFHDIANRVSYSTEQQVWAQNGITVTNDKAASPSNVGNYGGEGFPARFYKSSALTIECTGMTKIVFYCDDYKASYTTDLAASITDGTVTVDGTVVTVVFDAPVNSLFIKALAAQVRVDSITVNSAEDGDIGGGDEPEEPVIPPADGTLTIAEAIALGTSMEHNTYTETKYYVTGVITEVYSDIYGNMRITDDAGNILTLYGTWSADGSVRYDGLDVLPVAGDTITVYGIIGQYNGAPQMKNGWIVEHIDVEPPVDPEPPVADGWTVATELKAGVTYKLGLNQTVKGAVYYFTGRMSGYYGATDTAVDNAVDMFVEIVDGGYKLYFNDANGAKQYIQLFQSGTHYNFIFDAEGSVFTLDTERNALYATVGDQICYMGTYGNYVTVGTLRADSLKDTDYLARLYCEEGTDTPVDPSFDGFVTNGDFETGDATAWELWLPSKISPEAAAEGVYGAHLIGDGGWGSLLNQTIPVCAGKPYELSFVAKINAVGVNVQLKDGSWDGALLDGGWLDQYNYGDWTKVTYTVTPTTDVLYLNFCGSGTGNAEDAYVDLVRVEELKEPSFDGFITNGDFESGNFALWDNLWDNNMVYGTTGRDGGMAMNVIAGQWTIVRQKVAVKPNTNYTITFWSKDAVNAALLIKDGADTYNIMDSVMAGGSEWMQNAVTFNSGDNTSVFVCFMGTESSAQYTVDDVVMEEVATVPTIYGSVDKDTLNVGDTFTLDVYMEGNPGLCGWLVDVDYDITALELIAQTAGNAFTTGSLSFGPMNKAPTNVLWYDFLSPDVMANGHLFSLTFRVKADAPAGWYMIDLYCSDADNQINSNYESITFEYQDAYVTVAAHTHTYDNACDAYCNLCGAYRVTTHTYSNACDAYCNVCGYYRATAHTYSNACDAYCDVCNAYRTAPHTYSNACDAYCNVCSAYRTPAAHVYSNAADASCNVCGAIRVVDSATIYGEVSDTAVERGDTFTLDVYIQDNPGLCGWNVMVDYNETAFELVQAMEGNIFPAHSMSYSPLRSPFGATFADFINPDPDVKGDGVMVHLVFRVKDTATPGDYTFIIGTHNNDLDNFTNQNWDTIPVQFENTSVSVVAHTHTYVGMVTKAPTCGAAGIKSYTCSTCGASYTEAIPATGDHVYDAAFDCIQCGYSLSIIYGTVDADAVAPGDTFTLAVHMANNPGLVGWLLDVDFDSTALELVSQTKGEAFNGIGTFSFGPMMAGYTNALWYDFLSSEDYTNNGCMFYLTFRVKEGASAGFSSIRLYCSDMDNLCNAQFETPYFVFEDTGVTLLDHRHAYDNACDAICNICGAIREVEPHAYESEVTLASTCVATGIKTYTCFVCGDSYTEVIPATGEHSYKAVVTAPDCVNGGYTTYTCTVCGHMYVADQTAPLGHNYESEITLPATCGTDGVMTYICSVCGDAYTVAIPATGNHTYDNACDATCNVCGGVREVPGHSFVGSFTCAVCGYVLDPDSDRIIYGEVDMSTVAPGDTFTVTVNMANNPGLIGWLVGIDYDMDAFEMIRQTKGDTFTGGSLSFGPMNKLPTTVLWFDFLNPNVTDEGTLFSLTFRVKEGASVGDAVIRLYCDDPDNMCNDMDENVTFEYVSVLMAVIDHHHAYDNACDATCNICGEVREVEPHAYKSEVTLAPTCVVDGVMTCICSACGDTYTEVIPATGEHTYESVITLAPTCAATGIKTYTCSVCGDSYTEVIPATGNHTYDNACDATCNVCDGVREVPGHSFVGSFTCGICGYALDVNSDPIIHGTVDVTDAAPGETFTLTVHMANNPGLSGWLVGIDYDIQSLELIEQTAGDIFDPVTFGPMDTLPTRASWYDFLSGDTTASGVLFSLTFRVKEGVTTGDTVIKLYSTDPDNFTTMDEQTVYFDFVDAVVSLLDHRHVYESAVTTAPTCVAEGVMTYTCSICGDSYTESIPATGVHTYDDDDDATCNDCDYVRDLTDPGDVNKDGKVNIRDVGLMQQWMNGWNVELDEKVGDVNNDGKVNIRDVGLMQQWMNGWNVELI